MKQIFVKNGFTLSEVLIALVVIGVIAALTVPALIQRTNKQEYVSALQKTYSTLSQVTNQIIAENGSPAGNEGWADSIEHVYSLFKQHLSGAKDCGADLSGCFASSYKNIDGSQAQFSNADVMGSSRRLVLADGVSLLFHSTNTNCTEKTKCSSIYVDINGLKKPNTAGRDFFEFIITSDKLMPQGCSSSAFSSCGNHYCTCKVLTEGRMNY